MTPRSVTPTTFASQVARYASREQISSVTVRGCYLGTSEVRLDDPFAPGERRDHTSDEDQRAADRQRRADRLVEEDRREHGDHERLDHAEDRVADGADPLEARDHADEGAGRAHAHPHHA